MSSHQSEFKRPKVLMVEYFAPSNMYTLELGHELKKFCDLTVFSREDAKIQEENMVWLPQFYPGGKGKAGSVLAYGKTLLCLQKLIRNGKFDVLHIQTFKNAKLEIKMYLMLRKYYKQLVMTVHNMLPHDATEEDKTIYCQFYERCDQLIVHNEASKKMLQDMFQIDSKKIFVIAHGAYDSYPVNQYTRDSDPRKRFLQFGFIRPYKGIDVLLRAISLLDEQTRKKCLFMIRGKQYQGLDPTDYSGMIRTFGIGDCVEFSGERVEDEEIPRLMANTDFMLFPYRNIYGSGSLLMAYTFSVPVIASDILPFQEETDSGKTGILFESENPQALKEAILECLRWDDAQMRERKEAIQYLVETKYNWHTSAELTAAVYNHAK